MAAIDTNSWQGIRAEVIRRIADGEWAPGELIPGEVDLADEFGCARATVNRALQDLADAGLIERKRKAGTRVALNPVRKVTVEVPVIRKDVEARGSRYSFALLGSRIMTPSPAITAQYGLKPDASLLGLWTLHHADHQPFALEERWVNLDVVPAIAKADLDAVSANEWLVQHMPLSRAEFSFSAASATQPEAQLLGCEAGAALFIVNRTTWAGDAPITAVRLAYAPGYVMETVV
jgi:GntR family histidine utilization transcriptional repressor